MSEIDPNLQAQVKEKLSAAAAEMELPLEVFMEIVGESMGPTAEDMVKLGEVVESGNYEDIQAISHKMKGTFGNLRLDSLVGNAGRINDLSKNAEGIDEIKQLYSALQKDFDEFIAIIKTLS